MSDIAVRFGFIHDEDGDREPAMGIYNVRNNRKAMYAIPLSSAYKYTDQAYMMRACFAISQYLQMHPDAFLINRIADTILSNLDTLIIQRPAGKEEGEVFGEGKVIVEGETIGEFEAYTNGDIVK